MTEQEKQEWKLKCLDRKRRLDAYEQQVFEIVRTVINKHDPESLLKLGAPDDEYDPESRFIAMAVVREGSTRLSVTELANIVAVCLHIEFHPWSKPVTLHSLDFDIAKELKPLIPAYDSGAESSK